MNDRKLPGIVGLALRARQAAMGMDACRMMIQSGKCGVLLLDETAGYNTRKKAEALCERNATPIIILPAGMIEQSTGKSNMVIGVQKSSFSNAILSAGDG